MFWVIAFIVIWLLLTVVAGLFFLSLAFAGRTQDRAASNRLREQRLALHEETPYDIQPLPDAEEQLSADDLA